MIAAMGMMHHIRRRQIAKEAARRAVSGPALEPTAPAPPPASGPALEPTAPAPRTARRAP